MRIRYPLVFAPLLLSLTMGSTDCESFETLTVPASDGSPPLVVDGVWWNGEYLEEEVSSTGNVMTYHLAPGESVVAISAGVDSGGLKQLKMSSEKRWTCCQGSICSSSVTSMQPIIETQPGGVGSTVSSGIWTGQEGSKLPTCSAGKTLKSYKFSWRTTATNFHGGQTTGQWHSIVYP